ncbi:MAG: NmrA family NAD(P)-binding protein [Terriglobia bacterium]
MYAITGASGNTGHVIAQRLLAAGQKVRAIGRDAGHLSPLAEKGAEVVIADVTDASALRKAFSGAKAVYVMIPPNPSAPDVNAYSEQVSDAEASAINAAEVEHAVMLSSVGADKAGGTGPVTGLHNFEHKLSRIAGLNALYVRAGYFMENVLPQVAVIKNFGSVAGPLRADLRVPMIAARDIGAFAADALLALDFRGKQTRELLGGREVSYSEVAALLGKAIGKPDLAYNQLPAAQLEPIFVQMGMSVSMARLLLEMSEAMNSGHMVALEPRTDRNSTPTSIEQFVAEEFVPRFNQKAAGA